MQSKEKPVTLIYKGSITQSTGEDWEDVPLTLETASPTFGIGVPTLTPWTISVYRPSYAPVKYKASSGERFRGGSAALYAMPSGAPPAPAAMTSRAMDVDFLSSSSEGQMQHRGLHVSSKGNVSATFGIPGLINIPSDGVGHNVTIAKLELDASMSWVCVPKKDGKVHLKVCLRRRSKRWSDSNNFPVNRRRSRMLPSTPSSLEVPVYTSMGVSSPSQMYHSSAQTRVSTVLSGTYSPNSPQNTHVLIHQNHTGSTLPSESPITHAPKTCLNLDSTANPASTLSASVSRYTTLNPPEAPSPAPPMRSKSKSSTKCLSPRTPPSPLSSSNRNSCCPLRRAPVRSARRLVRRLENSRCRRR